MREHIGRVVKLKPEYEDSYIEIHKNVWPGVLDRITKCNISNYSIFLLDDILFSYNEYLGYNYDSDMKLMADYVTKAWWKITDPMQERFEFNHGNEWWLTLNLISHFDELAKPFTNVKRFAFAAVIKSGTEDAIKNHFKSFGEDAIDLFKEACLQNQSVFLYADRLYVYFEYAGKDFPNDDKKLNSNSELKKWNDELENFLSVSWKEMKEEFHTH